MTDLPGRSLGIAAITTIGLLASGTATAATAASRSSIPPPARAHVATVTPRSVVRHWMRRTQEVGHPGTHFTRRGPRATAPDGDGGSITAIVGGRYPTADGKGQLVFFFHGRTFLGWDTSRESIAIAPIRRGRGSRIRVPYVHYARKDALCCPTRGRLTVTYRWTRGRLVPNRRPPNATGARVRLRAVAARWHACADVGPSQTDTSVYEVRALRIGCPSARHILRVWYYDRSAPNAGPRGWHCRVTVQGYSERHSCARGRRRIGFTLLSA